MSLIDSKSLTTIASLSHLRSRKTIVRNSLKEIPRRAINAMINPIALPMVNNNSRTKSAGRYRSKRPVECIQKSFLESREASRKLFGVEEKTKKIKATIIETEAYKKRAKAIVKTGKMTIEERKHKLFHECFSMIGHALSFPFCDAKMQLKGMDLIGDIMAEFRDYNGALLYYFKAVTYSIFI